MPPEETTLQEQEVDQTAEGQPKDSQDQAETARLKEALNQADIEAIFGTEQPRMAEQSTEEEIQPESEAESELPETVIEVEKPSPAETKAGDVNQFKGSVKVLGKTLDVEYEGDDLARLVQKGLAFETYEKWDDEREVSVRTDEREKIKAERSETASLHEAAYKDLSYLYTTNKDFKEYWDSLISEERGKLPGSAEYIKRKTAEPKSVAPQKDPEIETLKREIQEIKAKEEEKEVNRTVEGIIDGFAKLHPGVDVQSVFDYALANNFTINVFGNKVLERAYHAMIGEGKLKAPDKTKNDEKEVIDQIKNSKKIPQIPAGNTSGRVGKVADMDLDDSEFKRKSIANLPQNPDDLFK